MRGLPVIPLSSLTALRDAVLARDARIADLRDVLGPARASSAEWRLDCDTRELPFKDAHIELMDGSLSGAVAYLRTPIATDWSALVTAFGPPSEIGPPCDGWGEPISHAFSCAETAERVPGLLMLQVSYRHPDEPPSEVVHVEAFVVRRLE